LRCNVGQLVDLLTDQEYGWRSRYLRRQGFQVADIVDVCSTGSAASLGGVG
jgi:hypothetical protein